MQVGRIEGATRVLGNAQGYLELPVSDDNVIDKTNGEKTPRMTTSWEPTPAELHALERAHAHLRVHATWLDYLPAEAA